MKDPRLILFLSGGMLERDPILGLQSEFAACSPWPKARKVVITMAPDFERWPYEALHVERQGPKMPMALETRWLIMRALGEGLVDEADVLVSTSWLAAIQSWSVAAEELMKGRTFRVRPLVYLSPQVNDSWEYEASARHWQGHHSPDEVWWMLQSHWPNVHSVHLSAWDRDVAVGRMRRGHANPPVERAHAWRHWRWQGFTDEPKKRQRKVVWASRLNPLKNPKLATEIAGLLEATGTRFEAYAVTAQAMREEPLPNLRKNLPRDEYLPLASSAMVHLVTTHNESWMLTVWELAERGVVPVVRDRPWIRAALPGWPLLYRNAGEAVVMCETVMEDYQAWRERLREVMEANWTQPLNGPHVWQAIWEEWKAWLHTDVEAGSERMFRTQRRVRTV